ncbi:MAG: hypothetical protein Q8P31_01285 [Bacillota bacterium]|nr:hypothetical protein [Bacillota bacterium]
MMVPIGYLVVALCFFALVSSILAGSVLRTVVAVGCVYLALTALDHNREVLATRGHVDQGVVDEAGAADEGGEGD